jgi:hypothetical protein
MLLLALSYNPLGLRVYLSEVASNRGIRYEEVGKQNQPLCVVL